VLGGGDLHNPDGERQLSGNRDGDLLSGIGFDLCKRHNVGDVHGDRPERQSQLLQLLGNCD
jgi:hypothetical protein